MFIISINLYSLVLSWQFFGLVLSDLQECDLPVQDKCLFLVSSGRSGSTALMNALNNMDNIFIRGENQGLFYLVESVYNNIKYLSNQKLEIEDEVQFYRNFSLTHKPAHFNIFPNNTADCIVKSLFKTMYGYKQFDEFRVGFKEVRYGPWQNTAVKFLGDTFHNGYYKIAKDTFFSHTETYQDFKDRLQFLLNLCKDPKIILNIRKNSTSLSQSVFFRKKHVTIEDIKQYKEWEQQYNLEYTNITFMLYYEDMYNPAINQTLAYQLMDFLDVPKNPDITFAGIRKG